MRCLSTRPDLPIHTDRDWWCCYDCCLGLFYTREHAGLGESTFQEPKLQLKQVVDHFGLRFDREQLMTRCCECNGNVSERLTAAQLSARPAADGVPPHVLACTDEFWGCNRCGKVRATSSTESPRRLRNLNQGWR